MENDFYVSSYAKRKANEYKQRLNKKNYENWRYAEDFADSVKEYLNGNEKFKEMFPNRWKVMEKYLGGK